MAEMKGHGKSLWRSPDDLAGSPESRAWAESEFPALVAEPGLPGSGFSRRRLMTYMGATLGLAGLGTLGGCRRSERHILPYPTKPPEIVPGKPLFYATSLVLAGEPIGVLAETHEGRPTKLEGHPKHPASMGSLPAWAQASILDLYDPDRARVPLHDGQPVTWDAEVLPMLSELGRRYRERRGAGLAILSERYASPALDRVLDHLIQGMPEAVICEYEASDARAAQARVDRPTYDLSQARVILSLDADFLATQDRGTRYQRQFASGRTVASEKGEMNRLYVIEPHLTVTGMAADHRLRLKASRVEAYAWKLARAVAERTGGTLTPPDHEATLEPGGVDDAWIDTVADDLVAHADQAVVIGGDRQTEGLHAAVDHLNRLLNAPVNRNTGRTSFASLDRQRISMAELASRLDSGEVDALVILGGNPACDAPADLHFASRIAGADRSIHLSLYHNETSAVANWHLPAAHPLESWGDAWDGQVLSSRQPMIDPLFGGRTPAEIIARIGDYSDTDPYPITRDSFRHLTGEDDFERRWQKHLHEGFTAIDIRDADGPDRQEMAGKQDSREESESRVPADGIELVFGLDASVFDGRFANNGWLQECPDPVTKLTWDNAAICSPATADKLEVTTGDMVEITVGQTSLRMPVMVMPGSADDSILLALGYGRKQGGSLARHAGFDVYPLRAGAHLGFVQADGVVRTGERYPLATTQDHWSIDLHGIVDQALRERAILREADLATYRAQPDVVAHMGAHVPHHENIYKSPPLTGEHQWAMAIDLNKCIGCNACAVACQAENNIPIVGKDEVLNGREMNWMRIDRYFRGDDPAGDVGASVQPMLCQHCENAPCEPVCPVNATVHDQDGLNVMVYNRCIGTRYCSNNCPYKVRRFNFFDFNTGVLRESDAPFDGHTSPDPTRGLSLPVLAHPSVDELLKMQKNPDVTVRMRGVMEKCTFCVQRIQRAKIDMKVQAGQTRADTVPDDMLQTACQQACPSQAIVFGNQNDPDSAVARAQADARNYTVLEHLNVRPRTSYLARLRNLNPHMPRPRWLEAEPGHHDGADDDHAPASSTEHGEEVHG